MNKTSMVVLAAAASGILLMVGLWQIEMMWLHKSWQNEGFALPFGEEVPWWFARDLWYGCIVAAFAILAWIKVRGKRTGWG